MFQSVKIEYDKDEYVVAQFRKHWFVFLIDVMYLIPLALAPVIFIGLTVLVGDAIPFSFDIRYVYSYEIFFSMMWLLIAWIMFFIALTDYYLDVLRVTNKRIIDVDQRGFFSRNVATMTVANIQDITIDTAGFFGTILHYGSVKIQSAGEGREFTIHHLARPELIKATLSKLQREYEERVQEVKIVQG